MDRKHLKHVDWVAGGEGVKDYEGQKIIHVLSRCNNRRNCGPKEGDLGGREPGTEQLCD